MARGFTHLKYSSLGLTYVLFPSILMFSSFVRFPAVFANVQKVEFLMDVMFLSRRMHESVPIRNQYTSAWRGWQRAAVGHNLLPAQVHTLNWGEEMDVSKKWEEKARWIQCTV